MPPISAISLTYNNVRHGRYFVVTVHRGDLGPNSYCQHYYRPSRASLLRVNRAMRRLMRRVDAAGYVADAPAVTVELENEAELRQLVSAEFEAATLLPVNPEHAHMSHLAEWDAEQILRREG